VTTSSEYTPNMQITCNHSSRQQRTSFQQVCQDAHIVISHDKFFSIEDVGETHEISSKKKTQKYVDSLPTNGYHMDDGRYKSDQNGYDEVERDQEWRRMPATTSSNLDGESSIVELGRSTVCLRRLSNLWRLELDRFSHPKAGYFAQHAY